MLQLKKKKKGTNFLWEGFKIGLQKELKKNDFYNKLGT